MQLKFLSLNALIYRAFPNIFKIAWNFGYYYPWSSNFMHFEYDIAILFQVELY